MKHRHRRGSDRTFTHPEDQAEQEQRGHHRHRGGRHGGQHRGHGGRRRLFDYGELRLVVLAMIGERPRHGYELMRAIEERLGGSYSPSPGVIYPTLSWIEDMGFAIAETDDAGRKRYRITPEGQASIDANRAAIDALLARIGATGKEGRRGAPAPVIRAMENLKLALRLRLTGAPVEQAAIDAMAAAIDDAARKVERS